MGRGCGLWSLCLSSCLPLFLSGLVPSIAVCIHSSLVFLCFPGYLVPTYLGRAPERSTAPLWHSGHMSAAFLKLLQKEEVVEP